MAIGVLIESLSGGPTVSATASGNTSGDGRKVGGAREWIKNKLKALSPCIMCVQYIGGCSVHRGMFSTSGGVQYIGGIS